MVFLKGLESDDIIVEYTASFKEATKALYFFQFCISNKIYRNNLSISGKISCLFDVMCILIIL